MNQEFNKFRSLDDSTLQRDTKSPKSPLDHLDLATRHKIFFRPVGDQDNPKSLPGDNSPKQKNINLQDKVTKEQKEYKENSCIADEALTQARVEHVSQAKTGRWEGFASTTDNAEITKRESPESYWETIKSLSRRSLSQLAKETVGHA